MDKYKNNLLNRASKLDAMVEGCGEITKYATAITEENSQESTITLLRKISDLVDSQNYPAEVKKMANALKGPTWQGDRSCTGTCNCPRQKSGCQQMEDHSRNLSC